MPSLKVLRGPEPGRIYELTNESITIGRGRKNEIIIHDNEISREHCRLVKVLFDYELSDLSSTNGTFLNGRPVSEASSPLFDKNIIELGDSIVLEYMASTEASTTLPEVKPAPEAELVAAVPPVDSGSTSNYYLVIRRRSQLMPEVYLLDSPLIDIGRHLDNAICLTENQVSRFHLRLNRMEETYILEDLGSMNGTMVNNNRVDKTVGLQPGDYITIGHMVEMWFTNNLDTLRMVPYTPQEAAAARKITEEFKKEGSSEQIAKVTAEVPPATPPVPGRSDASLPGTTLLDPDKLDKLAPLGLLNSHPELAGEASVEITDTKTDAEDDIYNDVTVPAEAPLPPADDAPPAGDVPAVGGGLLARVAAMPAPLSTTGLPDSDASKLQQVAKLVKDTEESPSVTPPPDAAPSPDAAKPEESED